MKNKYLICGVILAILIILLSVLTVRYYNYKLELMNNPNNELESNNKGNNPNKSNLKDENLSNNQNKKDDVLVSDIAKEHIGKNTGDPGLKTPTTFSEFETLVKRDVDAMFVFGRTGCVYCEQYYPVLESVVREKQVEIIYINLANFSKEDYSTIIASDITIPGKCVADGVDRKLGDGFGTPLSLFINNYETYDCIRGYKNKTELIKNMKKAGYIV